MLCATLEVAALMLISYISFFCFNMSCRSAGNLDSASGARCLMPARCTIMKFSSDSRRRHVASLRNASDIWNSQLRGSRSVLMRNLLPIRYNRSGSMTCTTERSSLCVSASFSKPHWEITLISNGLCIRCSYCWSSTQPTEVSQLSVISV